ncbi:hypothetical protein [Actinocorallia longicatena]|uniref:Secreted protein n=1 Tax=Actinocorallia longicatena TaxID=111803 RepID=A0ABP6QES2_9ACTN
MNRSQIFKTVGTLGTALAMATVVQGSASANAWSSSYPTWGTATCSSAAQLSDSQHVIISCIMYGGTSVQGYTVVMNGNGSDRLLPETNPVVGGLGIVCDPAVIGGSSTKFCLGPKLGIAAGCHNFTNKTNYTWYTAKVLSSPTVNRCG